MPRWDIRSADGRVLAEAEVLDDTVRIGDLVLDRAAAVDLATKLRLAVLCLSEQYWRDNPLPPPPSPERQAEIDAVLREYGLPGGRST